MKHSTWLAPLAASLTIAASAAASLPATYHFVCRVPASSIGHGCPQTTVQLMFRALELRFQTKTGTFAGEARCYRSSQRLYSFTCSFRNEAEHGRATVTIRPRQVPLTRAVTVVLLSVVCDVDTARVGC